LEEEVSFTELAYRGEGFTALPLIENVPVHFHDIIECPSLFAANIQ
jgi:hypothetical protein